MKPTLFNPKGSLTPLRGNLASQMFQIRLVNMNITKKKHFFPLLQNISSISVHFSSLSEPHGSLKVQLSEWQRSENTLEHSHREICMTDHCCSPTTLAWRSFLTVWREQCHCSCCNLCHVCIFMQICISATKTSKQVKKTTTKPLKLAKKITQIYLFFLVCEWNVFLSTNRLYSGTKLQRHSA